MSLLVMLQMLWINLLIIFVMEYRETMSRTWINVIFLTIVNKNNRLGARSVDEKKKEERKNEAVLSKVYIMSK